eukprot:CAMPEP_0198543624 /NCGR_PEP_ID=MMETSP1462-20131121/59763_1 /TAXON_ID=1333877 /ORGANISM="Brandtodinium nutriculum, Strain RCC3387" /LENGTH=239 /DNA_ID=CAMNT_0044273915 /DNA_START=90 /DNA_END=807 /DNA_ORIENTATION=-
MEMDKYQNFSDTAVKDRIAFLNAQTGRASKPPPPEPSGFTSSGWDKYYFFSDPYQATMLHPTAYKGRMRPAMAGPTTFNVESFSSEDLAEAKRKMAGKGARTAYSESFSQIAAPSNARLGPIKPMLDEPKAPHGANIGRHHSEPQLRERTAADILMNLTAPIKRRGPHWPPATKERPDPVKVRAAIFAEAQRAFEEAQAASGESCRAPHGARAGLGTLVMLRADGSWTTALGTLAPVPA